MSGWKYSCKLNNVFRGAAPYTQKTPQKTSLQDAYGVLGLTPYASKVEVKNALSTLNEQNHPDKLSPKDYPKKWCDWPKKRLKKSAKPTRLFKDQL